MALNGHCMCGAVTWVYSGETTRSSAAILPASGAELAVVYYSGHGVQIDRENFLIPVDASLKQAADIEVQTLKLNDVLEQ
ncbi:hypothetical protein NKJ72_26770 [Mesorhizobium sp. M0045]|uniref:hypothetical protein n=1 Tax=unclassified Mesorhizobium TaxID=325217 RepID=UPI00333C2860